MISFGLPNLSFGPVPTVQPATIAIEAPKPASGGSGGGFWDFLKPKPSGGGVADLGSALSGAGSGAATGASVSGGNPIGAAIGAGVGLLEGLFGKKSATGASNGGLSGALAAGLGSLGLGGGGGGPTTVTQNQSVTQGNSINVTNVLGGRTFGDVDESGNFDTFKAISDVFAIKAAMESQNGSGSLAVAGGTPALIPQSGTNYMPILLLAAAGGVLWLLLKK